jgi:DNA-binding HxlR family transcriptional regulator
MANIFIRFPNKLKVIGLCQKPMSFIELKQEVEISDAGLSKMLKRLRRQGWLQRQRVKWGGRYSLTPAGRRILPQVQRVESALGKFKTSHTPVKYVTFDHQGLEGEDADLLEQEITQAISRYIPKHPDKPITLMIRHNPPVQTSNPAG